jgi:predicted negative regulator of RcsB-dependent stress response
MVVPYMLTLLADARRRAGRADEAMLTLDEALAVAAANGERWYEAETLRLRGELLLEVSDERSAEQALRQALELARAQEARALERRAALSLARLRGAGRTSGADDSG